MADDNCIFRTIAWKAFAGLFSYCYTQPLGGVDVPYEGCDLFFNLMTFDLVFDL